MYYAGNQTIVVGDGARINFSYRTKVGVRRSCRKSTKSRHHGACVWIEGRAVGVHAVVKYRLMIPMVANIADIHSRGAVELLLHFQAVFLIRRILQLG